MSVIQQSDAANSDSITNEIRFPVDRMIRAALNVLTADGTSINVAVRRALIEAAEQTPAREQREAGLQPSDVDLATWVASQTAHAPPLTKYQTYVLHAVFVDRHQSWLTEEVWQASQKIPETLSDIESPPV